MVKIVPFNDFNNASRVVLLLTKKDLLQSYRIYKVYKYII